MYGWNDGGWWMMGIGSFFGLLVLLALVWLIVVVARGDTAVSGPDPRSVLADRFARGEIDAEEYRQRLDVLRRGR